MKKLNIKPVKTDHPLILKMVTDLKWLIPTKETGTYNIADPTYFEKGSIKLGDYTLSFNDCTWAIDYVIKRNALDCDGIPYDKTIFKFQYIPKMMGQKEYIQYTWSPGLWLWLYKLLKDNKTKIEANEKVFMEQMFHHNKEYGCPNP